LLSHIRGHCSVEEKKTFPFLKIFPQPNPDAYTNNSFGFESGFKGLSRKLKKLKIFV